MRAEWGSNDLDYENARPKAGRRGAESRPRHLCHAENSKHAGDYYEARHLAYPVVKLQDDIPDSVNSCGEANSVNPRNRPYLDSSVWT